MERQPALQSNLPQQTRSPNALLTAWPPAEPPVKLGVWCCLGEPSSGFPMNELPPEFAHLHAECLTRAIADLTPATADQIDQAIVLLAGQQLRRESGISAAALENSYHQFLDLPADLLMLAVQRSIQNSPFRPMVSDMRGRVSDELDTRQRRLMRLEASGR